MGLRYNPNWNAGIPDRTAYGGVPQQTMLPNRTMDLMNAGLPIGQFNQQMSTNILDDLAGNVSYDPSIQFAANTGLRSGLMGSDFARRAGASDYLSRVEQAKQRGQQNALATINTTSNTQTVDPGQQIALGQDNAMLQAAPDPKMAAESALGGYQAALNRASAYYQPSRPSMSTGGNFFPQQQQAPGGYGPIQSYAGTADSPVSFQGGGSPYAIQQPQYQASLQDPFADYGYNDYVNAYNTGSGPYQSQQQQFDDPFSGWDDSSYAGPDLSDYFE